MSSYVTLSNQSECFFFLFVSSSLVDRHIPACRRSFRVLTSYSEQHSECTSWSSRLILSPGKLCSSGAGGHWCPCLPPKGTFPWSCVQFRHKATAASVQHRGRDHPEAFSCLSDSLHVALLHLQNSPAATAEASDCGDGQGFWYLQAGWHADWHLSHGESSGQHNNCPAHL